VLIVDKLFAVIQRGKVRPRALSVLPDAAGETVRDTNVENGIVAIGDDLHPKVIIRRHDKTVRDVSTPLDMTRRIAEQHSRRLAWQAAQLFEKQTSNIQR